MNDVPTSIEPVDLSPTRAELIARVRARGRQIRARRRAAITALAALVVIAIGAPAIALGSRSPARTVVPVTTARVKADFRIALVLRAQQPGAHFGDPCFTSVDGTTCYVLGETLVRATDVRSTSVVYDESQGWIVNLTISGPAAGRLQAPAGHQAAIVVNGRVVSAPVINAGVTGTTVTISGIPLTRTQAIALATKVTGRPPDHVAAPLSVVTSQTELRGSIFVAGTTIHGTLVIDNPTGGPFVIESPGACAGKFGAGLANATMPLDVAFTQECSNRRTTLAAGETRFPFTVITTYRGCTDSAGSTHGPGASPHCLPGRAGPPPLPPGIYTVEFANTFDNGRFPTPPGVTVRLTAGTPTTAAP